MPTSELYSDPDQAGSPSNFQPPAAPPAAPPARVEVAAPVVTKTRMKDENPDGSVRDTSTEAQRPSNDLNFRNVDDEALLAKKEAKEAPKEEPKPEVAKEAAPVEAPKVEKVYAGKFKDIDGLEKGYSEAEKAMNKAMQEAAELRKRLETQETAKAVAPPVEVKSPDQLKSEQDENAKLLDQFVTNPKKFVSEQVEQSQRQMQVALSAAQIAEQWRKDNPDIAQWEDRVAYDAHLLLRSDPELGKDPKGLMEKATASFREMTGRIRTAAAKEALTTETRVVPLLENTAQPTATEHPEKAPLTADEAFNRHISMLKGEEQRTRRNPLNRGR